LSFQEVTEQDKLAEQVENIEHRVRGMETMMKALLKHHKIKLGSVGSNN
jgi:hypothetical protein